MAQEEIAKGKVVQREAVFHAFFDSGPRQSYKKKQALPVSHLQIYESTCLPTAILYGIVGLIFLVYFMTLDMLASQLFYTMKLTHLFVISDFLIVLVYFLFVLVWGFGDFLDHCLYVAYSAFAHLISEALISKQIKGGTSYMHKHQLKIMLPVLNIA